jgi:hypothetical protein
MVSALSAILRLELVAMGSLIVTVDPRRGIEGIVQIMLKIPALVVEVVGHTSTVSLPSPAGR